MQNTDSQLSRSALECPYLHGDNDLAEVLERLARSDLNEDEETRVRCLEELRSRLRDEPGLRWQDDDTFLLSFLRARKFSVDRALSLVKGYYGIVGKYPHLHYNVDRNDVSFMLAQNCLYVLPQRDTDGCTVAIFRRNAWDPKLLSVELLHGVGITCLCHVLRHNSAQIAGLKLIFDFEGFSLAHLSYVRPWHIWLFGEMLQVHFHGKNLEALHQFINPGILPAEYGGEQPSFDNSGMREVMEASADYTDYVHSFGYEKHLKALAEKQKSQDKFQKKR